MNGEAPRLLQADGEPGSPAWEIALSHALLLQVARREIGPVLRLYRPLPTLAFGRLDKASPGFAPALAAARSHRFHPVLRLVGGRAAAYHSGSLVFESICAEADAPHQTTRRYEAVSTLLREALGDLGAPIAIGPLSGEYCAGRFSLNLDGRLKVAGIAQRAVRGAGLASAAIVVNDGQSVREVLADVYRALQLDFDPATAGALEDELPGLDCEQVTAALIARLEERAMPSREPIGPATRCLARTLIGRHRA